VAAHAHAQPAAMRCMHARSTQPHTPLYPSLSAVQDQSRRVHYEISTRGVAKVNFLSITQNGRRVCAWLDELQHGHHRSGEVYFPNVDSHERGQSSGAVRNNRLWQTLSNKYFI
jgi:hypothetical protein